MGSHLAEKDNPETPFYEEFHEASCFVGGINASQRMITWHFKWWIPHLYSCQRRN